MDDHIKDKIRHSEKLVHDYEKHHDEEMYGGHQEAITVFLFLLR